MQPEFTFYAILTTLEPIHLMLYLYSYMFHVIISFFLKNIQFPQNAVLCLEK